MQFRNLLYQKSMPKNNRYNEFHIMIMYVCIKAILLNKKRSSFKYGIMRLYQNILPKKEVLLMNIITAI